MKICIFGNGLLSVGGGINQYFFLLAKKISELDNGIHEITIVSHGNEKIEVLKNVKCVSLNKEVASIFGYMVFAIKALWFFLKHRDFDILHSGSSHSCIGIFSKLLSLILRKPLVHTVCCKENISIFCLFGLSNLIITSTLPKIKFNSSKGICIPPFIDLTEFNGSSQYDFRKGHDIVIGTIGSLLPRKGHEYLFKAIPAVVKKHPRVFFVLAVDTPSYSIPTGRKEMERLKSFIRDTNLDNNVIILGKVDIPKFMRSIDVFCFSYVTAKGSFDIPLSVLECLAGGAGLIATRVGAVGEVVKDGYNGLLIEEKDKTNSEVYVEKISQLIKDRTLLAKIRKNALGSVLPFDANLAASRILNFYKKLISG